MCVHFDFRNSFTESKEVKIGNIPQEHKALYFQGLKNLCVIIDL